MVRAFLLFYTALLCSIVHAAPPDSLAIKKEYLSFTRNAGQWTDAVLYRSQNATATLFIDQQGFTLKMFHPEDLFKKHETFHHRYDSSFAFVLRGHTLKFRFDQIQLATPANEFQHLPYYENYFLGDQPEHWKTGIYPAQKIAFPQALPHAKWWIYSKNNQWEFDWEFAHPKDHQKVVMHIEGADSFSLRNNQQEVCIYTSVGNVVLPAPLAYQHKGDQTIPVDCKYIITTTGGIGFEVLQCDSTLPLTIDPVLVFATYSGSFGDNFGFTASYDSTQHLYAGGIVDTTEGAYPVTAGAFQVNYGGSTGGASPVNLACDISLSKYAPDGKSLIWASYLGGARNEYPHSLAIDHQNQLLLLGTTTSTNFPIPKSNPLFKPFDTTQNGQHDLVVMRISSDGTQLLAGTYVGGEGNDGINTGILNYNYADDFRGDIYADDSGNVYVASCTRSTGFPVKQAFQNTKSSSQDGVVFSMNNSLNIMRWSSFLGGNSDDAAYSIKLDDSSRLFVAGGTGSNNLNLPGNGLNKSFLGGISDGFIIELNPKNATLLNGTYWGTQEYDQIYFIDFDAEEKIYLTGQTEGNINRTAGTYGNDDGKQFIARLSNSLSTQDFVTTFGTGGIFPDLSPSAFMVDYCNNIYFSGWGSDIGVGNAGTTFGLEITAGAIDSVTDGNDFYLYVLSPDAKNLLYATYWGGSQSEDHVDGGTSRFDKRGVVYQSVCASCPENPPGLNDIETTPGAVFPVNVSFRCSNASFKIDFQISYAVKSDFDFTPKYFCVPGTFYFRNKSTNYQKIIWDFGDGTTSTQENPVHVYSTKGKYTVRLLAIDSASCNIVDSVKYTLELSPKPFVDYTIDRKFCKTELSFEITGGQFRNPTWDLGDGTVKTGEVSFKHTYASPGTYMTKLEITHPDGGCKDTLNISVVQGPDTTSQIYLANVFTPNTDGINECLEVQGVFPGCDKMKWVIYNRWGQEVFRTDRAGSCWNGKYMSSGMFLPAGSYYYILEVEKPEKPKIKVEGFIALIY